MARAFGIVTSSGTHIKVEGLQQYRPIGAFSFLGRYRVIDFPISNMSNSGIDRIQVYVRTKPRSLAEHLGTGRHYNINSKRGKLQLMFAQNSSENDVYNTDIASFYENIEFIERMHEPYVIIAPSYMVYAEDYRELLQTHIDSGADITLLYHSVDNAREKFLNCDILNLNKQKGVESIEKNRGSAQKRNIFMDTYVMSKELFIELIKKARKISSMYTLPQIVNESSADLDIRGVSHRGYFASITDFNSYYNANISLIDIKTAEGLFNPEWPIRVNAEHILSDPENRERLPKKLLRFKNLPLLLETAVELGRRKAVIEPGLVVPQGYQNQLQFLLPICLTDMEKPNLAMTLAERNGYYLGSTCLTLEMAYLNARMIARPIAPWLTSLVKK